MINRHCYTYCKLNGETNFKAWDINEGVPVNRLIYATILKNTQENQKKLQELADLNKEIGLKIQLRTPEGSTIFETE